MKPITVSINPTYLCNFRCSFCYLTKEQLADNDRSLIMQIYERLKEIRKHTTIEHIDIYGGEVSLLPEAYMETVIDMALHACDGKVNIVTNFSKISDWMYRDDIDISVSWDHNCRERSSKVLNNIARFPNDVHVLMLASRCMIDWTPHTIHMANKILAGMKNIVSVEIKPYSTNQANSDFVPFNAYEHFVRKWFKEYNDKWEYEGSYEFVNKNNIEAALSGERNAWSDDHVYITPNGKFGVLEFDLNDNEFFLELDTFEQYIKWSEQEKRKIGWNKFCGECEYFGHCLSEHLREVRSLEHSCNGFKGLLDWYGRRES